MKPTRRGFLSAILAIPLAGWTGFRAVMGVKPLVYHPLVPYQGQVYANWLFEKHLEHVKSNLAMQFSADLERGFLGMEGEND